MEKIQFETPENIQVTYQPAGLGTRFVAWLLDNFIMLVLGILLLFALILLGSSIEGVLEKFFSQLDDAAEKNSGRKAQEEVADVMYYMMGIWTLVWGLGGFFYYTFSELLLRGQTIGKRALGIRVVKANGFSLDAGSILVRNIFRLVDQIALLWIVPVISAKSQRLGDMAAGTIVVSDKYEDMSITRTVLSQRKAVDSKFRFDHTMLKRLRPQDISAIEKILERLSKLSLDDQQTLLDQLMPPLVKRLQTEPPDFENRIDFLEDLMAAEYRRQDRFLG